jgi:nucleoside-diphosphate-sugar epimerase
MVQVLLVLVAASVSVTWALSSSPNTFIILGGTGRIGTAVATHLLQQQPCAKIILAGRNAERGKRAVQEVLDECNDDAQVEWKQLADVWDASALTPLVELGDCLIHCWTLLGTTSCTTRGGFCFVSMQNLCGCVGSS